MQRSSTERVRGICEVERVALEVKSAEDDIDTADSRLVAILLSVCIVVDKYCRTSDPSIYAAGDCTSHPSVIYDRQIRLESVHNALEQAKTAAANACGEDLQYSQVPWFWSDQYDLHLQIAGLSEGYDEIVIRGNPQDRSFACVYLKDARLLAIDAINAPRDFVQAKPLIANAATPDREMLADPNTMLKDLG